MRRVVIICVTLLLGVISVGAQSNRSTLLDRINEIKKQNDIYFWDQYTHPNADSAKVNATKRMLVDINPPLTEGRGLSVADIMPYATYISLDRGSLKQYFVYIKKEDVPPINGVSVNAHVTTSPSVGVSENVATPSISTPIQKTFVPDAFVQRVMQTRKFVDVYKLLKYLNSQGDILQFGKLKEVEDYSSLDLILFDMQSQEVITMLSPVTTGNIRINVVNGGEDSLDNYPTEMTAVIWYIKK